MLTKIQKWGNSLAIRIPRGFAEQLMVQQGSEVDLIWLTFRPQADHEQSGRRPTLLDQSPQGATRIIAKHKAHKMSRRATGFMVS